MNVGWGTMGLFCGVNATPQLNNYITGCHILTALDLPFFKRLLLLWVLLASKQNARAARGV